ncbi:Hypothetical protein CAP_2434 [Chondromyces apiculatus DSM 436]|uniref:Uncharacterized protein n=1 Tax=Chondromyces apiculatus DSM 436 TaxID=1192034 RepID=A0A017TAX6_9BACT|nr:Hypothetical protein CAP_2434 [Chondromyces apiculatus DSM 436]
MVAASQGCEGADARRHVVWCRHLRAAKASTPGAVGCGYGAS